MTYELAQVNVARPLAPMDAPEMAGFVGAVAPITMLADAAPGFVWRLPAGDGHVVPMTHEGGIPLVVNLTVWRTYEALHAFAYRSRHGGLVRHRSRWFGPVAQPSTALWWVPAGTRPTVEEALRRLAYLRAHGPTERAFSLRRRFQPDGRPVRR